MAYDSQTQKMQKILEGRFENPKESGVCKGMQNSIVQIRSQMKGQRWVKQFGLEEADVGF